MNADAFRRLALSLPDASEAPHFDRAAFRTPKRIFATLAADGKTANLKLDPMQQAALVDAAPAAFEAIPGGWGRQGWTTVTLARIGAAELRDVLGDAHASAWEPARPRKVAAKKGAAKTGAAKKGAAKTGATTKTVGPPAREAEAKKPRARRG